MEDKSQVGWGSQGVVWPPEVSLKTQLLAASNQPSGTQGKIDADLRAESSHCRLFPSLLSPPCDCMHALGIVSRNTPLFFFLPLSL